MENQYLAFMVRLWNLGDGESLSWRASLEDPHSGHVWAFATLDEMIAFLQSRTNSAPQREPSTDDAQ